MVRLRVSRKCPLLFRLFLLSLPRRLSVHLTLYRLVMGIRHSRNLPRNRRMICPLDRPSRNLRALHHPSLPSPISRQERQWSSLSNRALPSSLLRLKKAPRPRPLRHPHVRIAHRLRSGTQDRRAKIKLVGPAYPDLDLGNLHPRRLSEDPESLEDLGRRRVEAMLRGLLIL